jgi:hypothetical protein
MGNAAQCNFVFRLGDSKVKIEEKLRQGCSELLLGGARKPARSR